MLQAHEDVLITDYCRICSAAGPVEATVSLGPVQPPQCNGYIPQYFCDKLVPLPEKNFDKVEQFQVFRRP